MTEWRLATTRVATFPPQALLAWREPVAKRTSDSPGGAGPRPGLGYRHLFRALAVWLGRGVLGVEPSEGMRRLAVERRSQPDVRYVGGAGKAIPLRGLRASGGPPFPYHSPW